MRSARNIVPQHGKSRVVATDRISIAFGESPLSIRRIENRQTGQVISAGGEQYLLVRLPDELFEPAYLRCAGSWEKVGDGSLRCQFADTSNAFRAQIEIRATDKGIRFHAKVTAPSPVWLVEWYLSGLKLHEVIIPALGGQSLGSEMPTGSTLSYKYPFWWSAQFAIGSSGENGGCWLRSMDERPLLKLFRVKRDAGSFVFTFGAEAEAPLKASELEIEWFLDCYEGSWKSPVDEHRKWMEKAYDVTPLHENPHYPAWASKINFVLELWGMRKDQPHPHHTFEQMIERINAWAKLHAPEETLLYLPGFAQGGIDSHAPDYSPSEFLGGERKFKELVDTAHLVGYRVMIHTNVLAMTFRHPLYEKFKKYQVVDVFGRKQGWAMDMDGDWLTEPYFAYMNPGVKAWSELMTSILGELIRKFKLDAVFLDQTLLAFNVNRRPNFVRGMREHIERLQRAFPKVLFAGEGLHEQVVKSLPMAQIHGIDSIAEVHALDGIASWRNAHPVSTYLFGKYTKFVGHLLTRHPSQPMFRMQEDAYAALGVLPVLSLYDDKQKIDLPDVRKMIARAKES